MIIIVGPHPSGSHSIVTAEKPVGSADGADQINRRVGLPRSMHAKSNRHGVGNVRDLFGGHRPQPHIGVSVKAAPRWYPDFPGNPIDGPGPVGPGYSPGEGPGHAEAGTTVGAHV